jgi:hypothetical protein
LSLITAGGVVVSMTGTGTHAAILAFLTYGGCIGLAGIMYVRSQPRLPSRLVTIKDVIRAIVGKRRDAATQKNRMRPICVPSVPTLE